MMYVRILSDFLIFFFSIFVISSTFSIAISQIALGLSVLLFIGIKIIKKQQQHESYQEIKWFYKLVFIFIGWLILSSLFSSNIMKSLTGIKDEWLFLIIPIGIYLTVSLKKRQKLITILASIISIVSIYGFIQFFTGAQWFSNDEAVVAPIFGYRISGFFSYGITFGNYFSIAGIFLTSYAIFAKNTLNKKQFILFLTSGTAAICMAVLTFSRAPILAIVLVIIMIIVMLGKKWWKQGTAFIITMLVLLALLPGIQERFINEFDKEYSGDHKAGRVYIWKNSLKIIAQNPIFGVGIGNFKESYAEYIPSDIAEIRKVSSAHNDFIDIAANTGIAGLIIYLSIWIFVLRNFWNKYKSPEMNKEQKAILIAVICSSVCFAIISMFHGVFVDDEVRQLLMFLWGLGFAVTIQSQSTKNKSVKNYK